MARVGVAKSARDAIVDGNEESGETVIPRIAHEMFVQPCHEFGSAEAFAACG